MNVKKLTDKQLAQHRRSVHTNSKLLKKIVMEQSKRGLLKEPYDPKSPKPYPKEIKKKISEYNDSMILLHTKSNPKCVWVKINKGGVKTIEDSSKLSRLMEKYKANFNTHTENAMWFNFEKDENSFGFAKEVILEFPYLTVTIGR